jgi:hypothetical protein
MLTDQEKQYLKQAIDTAIKHSPDSMAAASVLIPIYQKCVTEGAELDGRTSN